MSEFAEDYEQKARLLAELRESEASFARLRTDLELARAALAQAERALVAERRAREMAEADAEALRQAIWSAHFDIHYRHKDFWTWEECPKPTCYPLREAIAAVHPGAALLDTLERQSVELARTLRELSAARKVVDAAARAGFGTEEDIQRAYAFDPNLLTARIRAYDAAVAKARVE